MQALATRRRASRRLAVLGLCLSVALAGCVAPQTRMLRQQAAGHPPAAAVEVPDVPFYPQEDHQCGPAALATVLQASGVNVTPQALVPEVYIPGRQGSLSTEMVAAARHHGRLVYPLGHDLQTIIAALHEKVPVLVMQNNGLSFYPVWHYAVVVGVDPAHETFYLRSGREQRQAVSFSTFEYTWARAGYWAVLVLDPIGISDGLEPPEVLRQLAELENAGQPAAAQAGYLKAALNWPDEKIAWLGLANTSVKLGDTGRADVAFRELLQRHPEYPAGLNNYAEFLLQQGRPREALPLAERAVKLHDTQAYEDTLSAVWKAIDAAKAAAAGLPAPAAGSGI